MAIPAWLAAAGVSAGFSALSSWQNRRWQERMSNTAVQRQVLDMRAAGVNPMLAARLGGASTPSQETPDLAGAAGRGVQSALEVRRAEAEIGHIDAQARLARVQAADIESTAPSRYRSLGFTADLQQLSVEERQHFVNLAKERAEAELEATRSSARAAAARALLDELSEGRMRNIDEFERRLGELGPAVRQYIEILRAVAPLATGGRR